MHESAAVLVCVHVHHAAYEWRRSNESDSGGDGVVAVHLSAALSGTLGAAETTAAEIGSAIRVIDSKSTAMNTGFVALAAARAAVDGAEHLTHRSLLDPAAAERDRLVGERLRIAHRAARRARDQLQRCRRLRLSRCHRRYRAAGGAALRREQH